MALASSHQINATLIIEIARLMGRAVQSEHRINQALRLLSAWADLHYARVMLPNYRTRELEVAYGYRLTSAKLESGDYTVGFDQGLTGYVWRSGQAALVTDVTSEPNFLGRIAEPIDGSRHHVGFICVPILVDGKAIGVLSAQRSANPRRRYADDVDVLRVIATMMGPVLHSMQRRAQNISPVPAQLDRDSGRYIQICEAHGIIGSSRALLAAVREIDQVKDSDAPILLLGESGTGKEMFARMVHRESRRRRRPFVCINCASIPEQLLESELFGHEKGSFTGALRRHEGKIAQAHEGTLFLDEIGDMPLELQAKLLRVLQDKQVQSIGSERPRQVDFRLVTATHVDLAAAVRAGRFRLDLYYRLNVIPISLPPLRQRGDDIVRLAEHFLGHFNQVYDRNLQFSQEVCTRLQASRWPGNIRQLQNFVERTVLKCDGLWITEEQLAEMLDAEPGPEDEPPTAAETVGPAPSILNPPASRAYLRVRGEDGHAIREALARASGNQTRAAQLLGMTPRQLRYRIGKLGIS
ncbi:MAG: sigma 54-interacting transcriptional regulator [Gammaproteobacteria bacterium]|jgi:Nif-specific regulatory protein|nr:sigma 54-interacting transcriptional regulator [Gammaproteobacteria bacterium]